MGSEAEKRGLYNLKSTPDALPYFIHEKNIDLFTSHHIFSKEEIFSRYEILLETYSKTIHIEAKTMEDMVRRDFLPALMTYTDEVAASISAKKAVLATLPLHRTGETADHTFRLLRSHLYRGRKAGSRSCNSRRHERSACPVPVLSRDNPA